MITRVEIDGFKSFRNFAVDLEPLTAIVGPNAEDDLRKAIHEAARS
jgi:AAA15 family ATPase/GTPase